MKRVNIFIAFFLISIFTINAQSWEGTWAINKNYNLKITKVTKQDFNFVFDCSNGVNVGQAEGIAKIKGNKAVYDPESICPITFEIKDKAIKVTVNYKKKDCINDAGNGVYYDGLYNRTESYEEFFAEINYENTIETQTSKNDFEEFWVEFTSPMGNNAKGNIIKEEVVKNVLFPLEINQDGKVYKYDKKKFIKNYDKIFEVGSLLFMKDYTSFEKVKENQSFISLGIDNNSEIFSILIEDKTLSWAWFRFYFGKVNSKYKLIYIESGI